MSTKQKNGNSVLKDRMDIITFGEALLRTRDLDPVYVGVHGVGMSRAQLRRWLIAYWCFYHVGAASWLSEWNNPNEFWAYMKSAAMNSAGHGPRDTLRLKGHELTTQMERWPRASERRYFRGPKCEKAIDWFRANYPNPDAMLATLWYQDTEKAIMAEVQTWPLFGPWIAFKAADMMERVAGREVQFDPNIGLIYETPRAALDMLANGDHDPKWEGEGVEDIYSDLLDHFRKIKAPPALDRGCGPQEVETILCKWKSHMSGHYWIGKDIHEQRAALAGWGKTAGKILKAYPPDVLPSSR